MCLCTDGGGERRNLHDANSPDDVTYMRRDMFIIRQYRVRIVAFTYKSTQSGCHDAGRSSESVWYTGALAAKRSFSSRSTRIIRKQPQEKTSLIHRTPYFAEIMCNGLSVLECVYPFVYGKPSRLAVT